MTDTTFKTKQPAAKPVVFKESSEKKTQSVVDIPVPHTDYLNEHGQPYSADYYELGDNWEVYNKELGLIEGYFKNKIDSGEIGNDTKTVKSEIKKMEKLLNLKDEARTPVKIGVMAEHLKFLLGVKAVKENSIKYGTK